MRVQDTHGGRPVPHGNVGYAPLKLYGSHTGPTVVDTPTPRQERGLARRQAKAMVRQAREDRASGAEFLRRLTTQGVNRG